MNPIIVCCRDKKKGSHRKIDKLRKKLTIPKSDISQCAEHMIKSKIEKVLVNQKILEEYYVKIYDINP